MRTQEDLLTTAAEIKRGFAEAELLATASRVLKATLVEDCAEQCLGQESKLVLVREALRECYIASGALRAREGRYSSKTDGWHWPIMVVESGWALGTLIGRSEWKHYLPPEIMPEIARAVEGIQFRRRHPLPGDSNFAVVAGWVSNARVERGAVYANVNLLKREENLRATLLMLREHRKLDLFSVSIEADFFWQRRTIKNELAPVATSLKQLIGIDLVAEGGAGGRFL